MCSKHPFRAICCPVNVYCDMACHELQRAVDVICSECLIHIGQSSIA